MKIEDIQSIEKVSLSNKDYCISWVVNNFCNFKCPFCYQKGNNNESFTKEELEENYKELLDIINKINNELREMDKKQIIINLIGGEPTLSNLPSLLKTLNPGNNFIKIHIITNFSCSQSYIDEIRKLISDNLKIYFRVSVHETEVNVNNMINKIKNNLDLIKRICIVIHDENSLNVYNRLLKEFPNIKVSPQIVNNRSKTTLDESIFNQIQYQKEDENFIVNGAEKFSKYNLINEVTNDNTLPCFKGFKCVPFIRIDQGKVTYCGRPQDTSINKIFFTKEIICSSNNCKLCNVISIRR